MKSNNAWYVLFDDPRKLDRIMLTAGRTRRAKGRRRRRKSAKEGNERKKNLLALNWKVRE